MTGDVLLLSNSRPPDGSAPFAHARDVLAHHLGGRTVWFLPHAGADHDRYTAQVAEALRDAAGLEVRGLHREPDPAATVAAADAVFVGGGNTFRLLHDVRRLGILDALRANTAARYTGSSAGTNLACPTIRTTNDMPILDPGGLDAVGRVPFQVNPHYLDPDPDVDPDLLGGSGTASPRAPRARHQGETREERIAEFHEVSDVPVVGLREGAWLHRTADTLTLDGGTARLFRRGEGPSEHAAGTDLSWLLTRTTSS